MADQESNVRFMDNYEGFYENHPSKEYFRRNISGIFFFDTFPEEEKRQPTCFEDCTPEKQEEIINEKETEFVKKMVLLLSKKLKDVSKHFDSIVE